MDGHVHRQAIPEAVGDRRGPEGGVQEAAWSAIERKRDLEAEAALKSAHGLVGKLPAIEARAYVAALLAQFDDCIEYVRDTNLLGLYHEMIMLDAMNKLYCLQQIVADSFSNDIEYVNEPGLDICTCLTVKQLGWRSAMSIIAGCDALSFAWADLERQGIL